MKKQLLASLVLTLSISGAHATNLSKSILPPFIQVTADNQFKACDDAKATQCNPLSFGLQPNEPFRHYTPGVYKLANYPGQFFSIYFQRNGAEAFYYLINSEADEHLIIATPPVID